jgi:hypothetical protein
METLVDRFVAHVNNNDREEMDPDEVPSFLRDGDSETGVRWKIVKADNSAHVETLAARLPARLPPVVSLLHIQLQLPGIRDWRSDAVRGEPRT